MKRIIISACLLFSSCFAFAGPFPDYPVVVKTVDKYGTKVTNYCIVKENGKRITMYKDPFIRVGEQRYFEVFVGKTLRDRQILRFHCVGATPDSDLW